MNIHIVCMAADCRPTQLSFETPGWEVWGMARDAEFVFRFDRVFEMHTPRWWKTFDPNVRPDFDEVLSMIEHPLYMHEHYPEYPASIPYPAEEVETMLGAKMTCTAAFMIGLAIALRAEHIHVSGVRAVEEHLYQRSNINHLIGFAKGRGIKVTDTGGLQVFPLDTSPAGKQIGHMKRYGLY